MAFPFIVPGTGTGPFASRERSEAAADLLGRLPSLPAVSSRLLGLMGQSGVNLKQISSLIAADATFTSEVLRMSNSAMFSRRGGINNIFQAIGVLGMEKVKGLACTVALRSYLGNALQIPALKRCWRHNLATAVVSSEIAGWARQDTGEAYTVGILHDIGRLGLIAADPAQHLQLLDKCATDGGSLGEHELEVYGIDHAYAGEWLASSWGLSEPISCAIRDHHLPAKPVHDEISGLLYYGCRIANVLGFSVLDAPGEGENPIQEFISQLSAPRRERLNFTIPELQILIASRVNALEA